MLSAINLAAELGSNFAEKIGRFYGSPVIGFSLENRKYEVNYKG